MRSALFIKIWPVYLSTLLLLLLAACTPEFEPTLENSAGAPIRVTRPGQENIPAVTPTPFLPSTVTPFATDSPTPYLSPTPPPPPPSPTPIPAFPGMVYSAPDGLWQIAADWQPVFLSDRAEARLSPNGTHLVFASDGHIWLQDTASGQVQALTQAAGREVHSPQWWPGRPDVVLAMAQNPAVEGPNAGLLSAVTVDGVFTLLESNSSNALPTGSPDGQTIAYDIAGQPALHHWDTGSSERLNPADFGLPANLQMGSPAWSPDGRQVAWYAAGPIGDQWQAGIAVFDLAVGNGWLLHPYAPIGRGGWFDAPVWSPDGKWLAFTAEDEDENAHGVWVVATNGGTVDKVAEEYFIGPGRYPLWHPDAIYEGFLVYQGPDYNWMAEPLTGYRIQVFIFNVAAQSAARIVQWQP